ncbi:MAG: hypothetical protein KKB62_01860 [Nanoarchaeota archaeon]|nr:hypothetical protein [Nanoarchaeota archaeon]
MKTPDLILFSQNLIVDNLILSPEDFFNQNSVILSEKFSLSISDIVKNHLQLSHERNLHNFKTAAGEGDSINFYNLLSKKFASSAIIHYELVNRENISFVLEDKGFFFYDLFGPEFQLKMAKRNEMYADVMREEQINYYRLII